MNKQTRGLLAPLLLFTHIPKQMKKEFIYFMVLWMNAFPVKLGISQTYLPQELLVWCRPDYKKLCCVPLGTYCKVHDVPVPMNTMAWWTHKGIALGPTGNLQGTVKFYCINTGWVLKRRLFTPMPMPNRVIERVNAIGEQDGQGPTFRFLNLRHESYKWTDKIPEDDPEFQGMLDDCEETAVYPDISAELPGVKLEEDEHKYQTVTDEPDPDFWEPASATLHNVGIDADEVVCSTRAQMAEEEKQTGPTLVKADADKIVYKLTFNLPDAGLPLTNANLQIPLGDKRDNTGVAAVTHDDDDRGQHYPLQACKSVVGNQSYDAYAPCTTFLQLGTVQVHRSVLDANKLVRMTSKERLLVTTMSASLEEYINDVKHKIDQDQGILGPKERKRQ